MAKQTEIYISPVSGKIFSKTIHVNAPLSKVWDMLPTPELMKKWMSETEISKITEKKMIEEKEEM